MLKRLSLFTLIFSILLSGLPIAAQVDRQLEREKSNTATTTDKRIALVIGNSAYKNTAALPNPVNDATDMVKALTDLGFEVISGTNQTKAQMQNLIRQFGTRLADTKAVGLFFYAGHGISAGGTNYLIPVDADIQAEDEIEEASVSINFLLNKMATANNGFNMVILDACRNNPFARKWRNYRDIGDKGGLARIDAPTGTLIAYATKPGEVASDGNGRNGLYTGVLLRQMRQKNVDVTKMLQLVRADVIKQSGGKQVPFDESSVVGDFYFAGFDSKTAVQNPTTTTDNSKTGEGIFWQAIENSTDVQDFENYLARTERGEFTGTYKAVAELKLFRLKKANSAALFSKLSGMANLLLKYNRVDSFSEGLAMVQIGDYRTGKAGFIDKSGKEVISIKYDSARSFSEGLATVRIGDISTGKWGFIDKSGKEVIPAKYDVADSFSEGLALVKIGDISTGKWGFIDKSGKEVIPAKYDAADSFSDGLARVRIGDSKTGKWGFIDRSGKEVVLPLNYDAADSFSDGLARVRIGDSKTGKWGFIDRSGKEVIPAKYDFAISFWEGLAAVRIGDSDTGKYGFIDKSGKEVIRAKYDFAFIFWEGLAAVRIGDSKTGKWGFIDRSGKEVIPVKYDSIWCEAFKKEGIIGVVLNGKKGFVDIYGNEYFDF